MSRKDVTDSPAPWGIERRLEFIDFRLRWDRTVNRADLIRFFRISPQQASADFARYAELAPENMLYDKSLKTYRATDRFRPAASRHDAQTYLRDLAALSSGARPANDSFIGWHPDCDVVRCPVRLIATGTFLRLLWAIQDGEELKVLYQSMRSPTATSRWIAPHAFASDGQRWHVRAWCHEAREFRDFVISRIQSVQGHRRATVSSDHDESWRTFVDIIVAPRAGLTEGQRRAIEVDFGMSRGRLRLSCRRALAFYMLRQLQLDRPSNLPPAAQPLELVNRPELVDVIAAGHKSPGQPPKPPKSNLQEATHERIEAR
ncbi:MAG: WYL domain-containing protein [Betaproteobacteria bacterium]|nr:WYL domain-containing protein [Betaproteobacteria bacterium]